MEISWILTRPFRKKPKVYKEGVDYRFIDFKNSDITGIELLFEKYKGVIYHYHNARVVEEGELAKLQFGYTIVYPGDNDIDELTTDEEYHTIMGDILSIILLNKAENEQTRTDNFKEFNLQ